jgi:hypothetical protein
MRVTVKAKRAGPFGAVIVLTAITGGNPSQKTEAKSGDEVGDLVSAFKATTLTPTSSATAATAKG